MTSALYEKALAIAQSAHEGQKRNDGQDYITHPIAVAAAVDSDEEKALALVHDTVEDQPTPEMRLAVQYLIFSQLGEEIGHDCLLLTKQEGENYYDFIMRIAQSGRLPAIRVKIADINHNLSDAKPGSRADKYRLARHILTAAMEQV
jgi:(p)ppGpp synthase/HD superfamily hydrolase